MTTVSLPSPPPPPPVPEHQDLAVMLRQIRFLHTVAAFEEQGLDKRAAVRAAILEWADQQG